MYIKLRKSKKSFRSIILLDFFCPLRRDRDVVRVYTIAFCYDKKNIYYSLFDAIVYY